MELAETVSTAGETISSSRIYCFKDYHSWTKINNFASNGGDYFCFTKKKHLLDDGKSFSVRTNMIAMNILVQWMLLIIFVTQKK